MIAALEPFLSFSPLLRRAGFPVAPDQTIDFVAAVGALGPRGPNDVRRAGLAVFAIPPERMADYDALFRAHFLGHSLPGGEIVDDENPPTEAHEPSGDSVGAAAEDDGEPSGREASVEERLSAGTPLLRANGDEAFLTRFGQMLRHRIPLRRTFRRTATKRGNRVDLRRTLRAAMRHEGEATRLLLTRRRVRQRRILVLIDVSGSMKAVSRAALRVAHRVVQNAERVEVFTLGTRLTRITSALAPAEEVAALGRAAEVVADFEGGTRLGEALGAFLLVPRFVQMARGAAVVVISDGLERADPADLVQVVGNLIRICWRTMWISPLAAELGYRPETQAMRWIAPMVAGFEGGGDIRSMSHAILNLPRLA